MSLAEIVVPIDIAPRFTDPPLSPARPRDYLLLLRDILYFPHRVRDYVDVYARRLRGEAPPPVGGKWDDWRAWLRASPIQVDFLSLWAILGAILLAGTVLAAGLIYSLLAGPSGLPWRAMGIGWFMGVLLAATVMLFGLSARNIGSPAVVGLASSMALAFWASFAFAPAADDLPLTPPAAVVLALLVGIGFGVALSLAFALSSSGFNSERAQLVASGVVGLLVVLSVAYIAPGMPDLLLLALASGLAAAGGTYLGAVRVDDFLFSLADFRIETDDRATNWPRIGRVTSLPFRHLPLRVGYWLDLNWALGLRNVASLWNYTAQQEAVRRGIHDSVEALKDDDLIAGVARVADDPETYPWEMLMFGDPVRIALDLMEPLREPKPATPAERRKRQRRRMRARAAGRARRVPVFPMETQAQAVVAGFWYLGHGYFAAARDAFAKGPSTPLAQEVRSITEALYTLTNEENLLANPKLVLPSRPTDARRKLFWDALDYVREMVRMAHLYRASRDVNRRHAAARQAQELLKAAADPAAASAAAAAATASAQPADDGAPAAATAPGVTPVEVRQLGELAKLWSADLSRWLMDPPDVNLPPQKPVTNPFMFAEPLRERRSFSGRGKELGMLRNTWAAGNLQAVFIYGQPLVGKTSLLYVAEQASQANVQLAWFRLSHSLRQHARNHQLLSAICTAVQEATVFELLSLDERATPAIPDLERAADPYSICEGFIRRACRLVQPRNLILVLDEFDALERVFVDQAAHNRFLTFLWHLHQSIKNFNVLFVSQRTPSLLEERTANPFAATARPLQVGNLSRKEVDLLLMPSDPNFKLQFMPEARREIFRLSGGHPYFVQLLAYSTVQQFNTTVAGGKWGEPLLGPDDVTKAADSPEFGQLALAYYWHMDALAEAFGPEFVAVLEALAANANGVAFDQLERMLTPSPVADAGRLYNLLLRMERYGVIDDEGPDGNWRILIELYRRWIQRHGVRALPGEQVDPV